MCSGGREAASAGVHVRRDVGRIDSAPVGTCAKGPGRCHFSRRVTASGVRWCRRRQAVLAQQIAQWDGRVGAHLVHLSAHARLRAASSAPVQLRAIAQVFHTSEPGARSLTGTSDYICISIRHWVAAVASEV